MSRSGGRRRPAGRRRSRGRRSEVSPVPTTDSTRPPAETTAPSSRRRVPGVQDAVGVGAGDDVAGARAAGVALGGDDDGHRVAVGPLQRRLRGQRAGRRRRRSRPASGVRSSASTDLGLRVAEAAVELDHLRAGRGQRQAGVEQAGERRAAARPARRRPAGRTVRHDRRRPGRSAPTAAARRRPCRRCSGRCRRRRRA